MAYPKKNFNTDDNGELTDDTANEYLQFLNNAIDERIQQRLGRPDIMHYYDAQIVEIIDGLNAVAEYDDYNYSVKNATGVMFAENDNKKYIKMGTTDGINYYAMYLLSPAAVDVEGIDKNIKNLQNAVSNIKSK